MATKYNIPQMFTDYREMINIGDLVAVIVAIFAGSEPAICTTRGPTSSGYTKGILK